MRRPETAGRCSVKSSSERHQYHAEITYDTEGTNTLCASWREHASFGEDEADGDADRHLQGRHEG